MDTDMTSDPEAFARANREARRRRLQSLTLEKAAAELEAILEMQADIDAARVETARSRPPRPLPSVSLALLLAGTPHENDESPPGS